MERDGGPIRIRLTEAQKEQIRRATGQSAEELTLRAEELEERIAPMAYQPWQSLE